MEGRGLIIIIYSKDDLPRPSPSSSHWRRSGWVSPRRWWNSEDGVPWDWVATSAALAHVQGNRSGHLINASPMSYPCLWDLCSFSRCVDRLCEKRLANIDSSWRMEEIKGMERRMGAVKRRGGIIGAQRFHEWFMQYKVAYSLGYSNQTRVRFWGFWSGVPIKTKLRVSCA